MADIIQSYFMVNSEWDFYSEEYGDNFVIRKGATKNPALRCVETCI